MRLMYFLLAVLVLSGIVYAANDSWEDVSTNGNETIGEGVGVGDIEEYVEKYMPVTDSDDIDVEEVSGDGKFFTLEFYIALGIGIIVLVIVGAAVWFFLRGPINEWDRQRILKGMQKSVAQKNIAQRGVVQKGDEQKKSFWDIFKIKIKK